MNAPGSTASSALDAPIRLVQTPRMIRRLLCLTLVPTALLALSACGFQLRDALSLPAGLDPVKVVSTDRYSPLAESLAESLTRAGAVPATPDVAAPAVLDLQVERWGDTPISVDERGRAQEFNLRYAVVFELRNGDGTVLVPQQNIELARAYISAPTNSIGTDSERDTLMREMQREMTASILRRIDAAASGGTPVGGSDEVFLELTDAARAAMEAADAMAPLPPAGEAGAGQVDPAPAGSNPADEDGADPLESETVEPVEPTPGLPR
jgi:LPS-assembly lipoprotein